MSGHSTFEPPFTDVRIERLQNLGTLNNIPKLVSVTLHPPAAGPEIELTFGTPPGLPSDSEETIREIVLRFTGKEVLALRRRDEPRDWTAATRPPGDGMALGDPGWFARTRLGRRLLGEDF